jgi:outer membrane protein OmpA-like peptidoglycan-associated protein
MQKCIIDDLLNFYPKIMKKIISVLFVALLMGATLVGCKATKTQKGAVIGTAGGGAAGAAIGRASGNTALGAIIGATVGGVTGAIIGRKMDKQAKEIEREVPGAKVERVGEGIVVEFEGKILFGFDESNLTSEARTNLSKAITVLNNYPDTDIVVQGHTDNSGTDSYNQTLSEKRAKAAYFYLAQNGISSTRLSTKGYGESAPKYDNETENGRSLNRRVEFLIIANEKMVEDAKSESKNR